MGLFPKLEFLENHIRPQENGTALSLGISMYGKRERFPHFLQDTFKKYKEKLDLCNTTGNARMKFAEYRKQTEIKTSSGQKPTSMYKRMNFPHSLLKYKEKFDPRNTTGYARMKSTKDRRQTDNRTPSREKPRFEPTRVRGFWDELYSWNITAQARMKSAEYRTQTDNKTTSGEKLDIVHTARKRNSLNISYRYEPTFVREFWDKLYSWKITAQARIKSNEAKKQTEKKIRSIVKTTNKPSDEKEGEVRAEASSRNTPEIKSAVCPKQTKKKAPSKELLNDGTPFIKWIRIIIVFWGITMASATASTQFVATDPFQTFNVTKGTNAVIRFDNLECQPSAIPYFTLRYKSEKQPFCCRSHVHYTLIDAGLRAQDQEGRIYVESVLANDTFSVILNIIDVSVHDGGRIELVFMLLNYIEQVYVTRTAMVNVLIPPAKAKCHLSRKAIIGHHYHVMRCRAPAENGKVALSCFQSNSKIIQIDIITDNNDMIRGTFWARFGDRVQCCSHLTTDDVTHDTCDHSIFYDPKSITTPISNNSSLEMTESPFQLDSRPTTIIGTSNSSDQVCVFMPGIPFYLRVIILAYISLSSLMYSEFSLNRHNAI